MHNLTKNACQYNLKTQHNPTTFIMKSISSLIITFLISTTAVGQTTGRYTNIYVGGLCSKTIILLPNGFYNVESGCEQYSSFSMGTWRMKKDTIQFHQIDSSFNIINRVVTTNSGIPAISDFAILKRRSNYLKIIPAYLYYRLV